MPTAARPSAEFSRRPAASASATTGEAFGESLDADGHDLAVQRQLAAEVVVEERLVDARAAGDAIDAGGGEAAVREFVGGGAEDRRPLVALDPLSRLYRHNN